MAMAILKKEQKQESRNVMLRVSIPAPLRAEIKKIKKICTSNGFYFDIKPDVIGAVEKAVAEAKERVDSEKKNRADNPAESEAQTQAQSGDSFLAAAPPEG
jgi:histidine ammonia-lyase